MADSWDTDWDNPDTLNGMSLATLHDILGMADNDVRKNLIHRVIADRLNNYLNQAQNSTMKPAASYELLEYVNEADKEDIKNSLDNDTINKIINARKLSLEQNDSLENAVEYRALLSIEHQILDAFEGDLSGINNRLRANQDIITTKLNEAAAQDEISESQEDAYDYLEGEGISPLANTEELQKARDAFIDKLAKTCGWDKTSKQEIEQSDSRLDHALGNLKLEPYNDNGLNPLYSQCSELKTILTASLSRRRLPKT